MGLAVRIYVATGRILRGRDRCGSAFGAGGGGGRSSREGEGEGEGEGGAATMWASRERPELEGDGPLGSGFGEGAQGPL